MHHPIEARGKASMTKQIVRGGNERASSRCVRLVVQSRLRQTHGCHFKFTEPNANRGTWTSRGLFNENSGRQKSFVDAIVIAVLSARAIPVYRSRTSDRDLRV